MENILKVTNLKKKYKNGRGIEDITFSIEKGDIYGLLGANGAGKTTTMKIIVDFIKKQSGEIVYFENQYNGDYEKIMSNIGSLIETPTFYSFMSAEKNLQLAAKYYADNEITPDDINDIMQKVKIYDYRNDKVKRFSLGMKQRLGLAIAMISKPSFYVLDEPANGLDIEGIVEIRNMIIELAEKYGVTFLVSSHQSLEIEKMCSKVGVIHDRILKESASIEEILSNHSSVEDYYMKCIGKKEGEI